MTYLHQLVKTHSSKAKRRGRGLGSNKGSKSGRGTTRHQTARTTIPLHFEGGQGRIVKRYPLMRGKAKNKSVRLKATTVRLSALEKMSHDGVINLAVLIEKSVVAPTTRAVKIVFDKAIEKKLTVQLPVSARVQEVITAAGGQIIA